MARLSQFRGTLTAEQIAEGMNRALQNASRLAQDAATLFASARLPSSTALSILSIEESGKVALLRQMAISGDQKEWQTNWKAYRSHTKKNLLWILGDLVRQGKTTLEDLNLVADPKSEHPDVLDNLKQLCLYTDCFTSAKWSSPTEIDLEELAPYLLKMAQLLASAKVVNAKEVELWRKHLFPVKNEPFASQKGAVAAWYHEMKLHGLSDEDLERVEAFLNAPSARTQA
jgi:AbiV family abortive infection protein